jgi:predicted deacetylase
MNGWAASLHDVAPATWPQCERLLDVLAPYRVPVTLLVTPHFHDGRACDADPAFVAHLRARVAAGDEVVLHGYSHLDRGPRARTPAEWLRRRHLTASEGEFSALDASTAAARIGAGRAMLERLGLPPAGFVAPAWLMSAGTRTALRDAGLRYTSTRDALYALPGFDRTEAPSLVYSTRTAWRRTLSRHWNRRRLQRLADGARIRVALHPAEADHARVLDEWRALLDALAATRRAALESDWLPGPAAAATPPADRLRA